MKKFIPFWCCMLLTVIAARVQAQGTITYVESTSRSAGEIVSTFPYDISLRNADGKTLNSAQVLANKKKQPTVLMFWLTTCVPCSYELKAFSAKYENWQKEAGFRLVAISTDFPHNVENFNKRVKDSRWPFEAYHDFNREFAEIMPGGLNGLPQVFLLDADGKIVYHKRKYTSGDEDTLFAKVKELIHQ